jgi:hypothetical protein
MANSIQGIGGSAPARPAQTAAATVKQSTAPPAQAVLDGTESRPISDATDLSSLGSFIKSTTVAATSRSSFRPELVASLRSQIVAGDYHPNPTAVAARVAVAIRA